MGNARTTWREALDWKDCRYALPSRYEAMGYTRKSNPNVFDVEVSGDEYFKWCERQRRGELHIMYLICGGPRSPGTWRLKGTYGKPPPPMVWKPRDSQPAKTEEPAPKPVRKPKGLFDGGFKGKPTKLFSH